MTSAIEHYTGITEFMGSNPFRPEFFFSGFNFTTA